ncbi:Eukaryotic translation initiation factor 3 subunit A [Sparganum proliferum]
MAPNQFLKPETAHEKAKELIGVGKKSNALEVLYEMMRFRRARNWQKSLEEPMLLFVELCIELKKNQHFKRIIHQYRNISIQVNPISTHDILRNVPNRWTTY